MVHPISMTSLSRPFSSFVRALLVVVVALIAMAPVRNFAQGPAQTHEIYPAPERAKADLAAALKLAAQTHKRVLLDFGGNWCGDCIVLDRYMHDPANRTLLEKNFVLVDINIGHMDVNTDIAERYQVPLERGVPAMAVLDEHGKLLYSQRTGEFEAMRRMEISSVTEFLLKWRPERAGCSTVMVNC